MKKEKYTKQTIYKIPRSDITHSGDYTRKIVFFYVQGNSMKNVTCL